MVRAVPGVLVRCDPSIKAIIVKIDSEHHDFIIEDLDDETVMVKEAKLPELKHRLHEALKDTQIEDPEDSGSEDEGRNRRARKKTKADD